MSHPWLYVGAIRGINGFHGEQTWLNVILRSGCVIGTWDDIGIE